LIMKVHLQGNAEKILQFIEENPGCHLRQIKNELRIAMGTVQYHLIRLERLGKITSIRRGIYKYYFLPNIFEDNDEYILQMMSQETAREIVMLVIERKNPTQAEIVNSVGITPASINWHVKRLIASKIINEVKEGRYRRYKLHDRYSSKYIIALLKNYYPGIWKKWSSRLAEMFLLLSAKEEDDTRGQQ
jgi:predicted transcriptional regulator